MDGPLNTELVTRAINFHGQQLQKYWEDERGKQDLVKHNVKDIDFLVYANRQKHLTFQDRGKRIKLQEFIVKKADALFSSELCQEQPPSDVPVTDDVYAVMPPFEIYLNVDKQTRLRHFFQHVKKGDYILGTIVSKSASGMMLKVLCTLGPNMRYVADINVKAACPTTNLIPAVDKKGVSRTYMMNDSVCCEVIEVVPDCDKMVCGMKGTVPPPPSCPPLGLVSSDDFPVLYKKALDTKGETYEAVLEKSIGFNNPNNISFLSNLLGLGNQHYSNMIGLRGRFPQQEYANELRQVQASKWAFRSVADGIEHFKAGRHTEAFQCLNKALSIDPRNVEGLVARGALYANSGNFQKAIDDFEMALKLNPSHVNARKYMGETLVALGRSYEEENKIEEARKAYQSCLSIIPFHEDAQNSLEFLKNKSSNSTKNIIAPEELILPGLVPKNTIEVKETLKQLLQEDDKKDKKKKKKSKNRKKRHRSSSSSSSSSSGSSHSSSSSSSSSSDSSTGSSDSDSKKRKKHRSKSHRREKQNSLSPLSKRMAMMDPSHDTPTNYQFNKPAGLSNSFGFEQPPEPPKITKENEYETKVRSFLEQTKDGDSDYEERVRKFLEETARWKKDHKSSEDKKKKKKKDKKAKKESKKKRKEKKKAQKELELRDVLRKELGIKEKRKNKRGLTSDDEDYILKKVGISKRVLDSLPDLDELETKLSAYYALEKAEKSKSNHSGSSSPIQRFDRSPSPTPEQKARQAVAEASASAPNVFNTKWKMQIANTSTSGSRFKKKTEREEWDEPQEKAPVKDSGSSKLGPSAEEKAMSIRKAMAMKEPPPKKEAPPPPEPSSKSSRNKRTPTPIKSSSIATKAPMVNTTGPVVLDKFGNFRIASPATAKKLQHDDDLPPLPPGVPPPPHTNIGFPKKINRPPEPPGAPRSNSGSPRRKGRTPGSRSSRSRSRSSSRSRSRSARRSSYRSRSRSRSYYSRSRSRSRSYDSRSRSRSRSYSGDRRRYGRGGFRGGRYSDRGTYYKPRFQSYKSPRGYNNRGRGGYRDYRDDRYGYRDFRGRGNRPYNNRGGNRRPRGRYGGRGGYRDYERRRYDRRDDSRSISRDRSYSREADDPMEKVNQEKEKIDKYIDSSEAPTKHDGPLSEGEDRDDYTSDKYVDRNAYDGKWADNKNENNADKEMPPETNIAEMDKYIDKMKKEKKEEMMERNKDVLKSKPCTSQESVSQDVNN